MSRANSDVAILRRLRRLAGRKGLAILAAAKPNPNGGYMLSNDDTRTVILGDKPQPYSASLEQIEVYLDEAGEDGNN